MANFQTHVTFSSLLGVGYAGAGFALGFPIESCVLSGGLCGLAGMLPDLDSDGGIPLRELMAFGAAIVPMLMIDRFERLGLSHEGIALAGGLIYLVVRFGVAEIFKRYTVHRGMWHSIPAAAIAGLLAFLVCACDSTNLRVFRSAAVVLGFVSHLVLDEIYSIDMRNMRIKKSFGTALKFWSRRSLWANVSTYGKLIILVALACGDPFWMKQFEADPALVPKTAREIWDNVVPAAWLR